VITHPEKAPFPDDETTMSELAVYYEAIAADHDGAIPPRDRSGGILQKDVVKRISGAAGASRLLTSGEHADPALPTARVAPMRVEPHADGFGPISLSSGGRDLRVGGSEYRTGQAARAASNVRLGPTIGPIPGLYNRCAQTVDVPVASARWCASLT
jgi:hypothetical protein